MSLPEDEHRRERPSKTKLKRDNFALRELGERLLGLSDGQLASLDLPAPLKDAVKDARRIQAGGARKRQLGYIGRLLRSVDAEPIREALAGRDKADAARHRRTERWRERLLGEGDQALAALVTEYPAADVQRIRQMVRAARKEGSSGKATKAARSLFRYLRELTDGEE